MIKLIFLIKRVNDKTFEEFVAYHRGHHAPLFSSIPETKQYVKKYSVSHLAKNDTYTSGGIA